MPSEILKKEMAILQKGKKIFCTQGQRSKQRSAVKSLLALLARCEMFLFERIYDLLKKEMVIL